MEAFINPARCCPECGSKEYVFRGRKKIVAEEGQPAAVETKYLCKACGHAWREKVATRLEDR
jgi:DNA-directed RNA polymerase subunit M/transcription elongation factor TFIIS